MKKIIFTSLLLSALFLAFTACDKDKKNVDTDNLPIGSGEISFSVNGDSSSVINTPTTLLMDTIAIMDAGTNTNRVLFLMKNPKIKGTHTLNFSFENEEEMSDMFVFMTSTKAYMAVGGYFNITEINDSSKKITGSYNFFCIDAMNESYTNQEFTTITGDFSVSYFETQWNFNQGQRSLQGKNAAALVLEENILGIVLADESQTSFDELGININGFNGVKNYPISTKEGVKQTSFLYYIQENINAYYEWGSISGQVNITQSNNTSGLLFTKILSGTFNTTCVDTYGETNQQTTIQGSFHSVALLSEEFMDGDLAVVKNLRKNLIKRIPFKQPSLIEKIKHSK